MKLQRETFLINSIFVVVRRSIIIGICCLMSVVCLYTIISSPPLHLVYDPIPDAGVDSVYVPGKIQTDANVLLVCIYARLIWFNVLQVQDLQVSGII
jgi:hypothetical protein